MANLFYVLVLIIAAMGIVAATAKGTLINEKLDIVVARLGAPFLLTGVGIGAHKNFEAHDYLSGGISLFFFLAMSWVVATKK